MLSKKYFFLAFLFILLGGLPLFAQDEATDDGGDKAMDDEYPYPSPRDEEYKDFVPQKRHDQQDKFMDNKYSHPARPRDQWEVGLDGGLMMISGDVKARPGWGVGLHVRKSIGYIFSLRANLMLGKTSGRNWQGAQGWNRTSIGPGASNAALAGGDARYNAINEGGNTPDYRTTATDVVFYNYQTRIREFSLSGIINIHNIRFHKKETNVSIYGLAGIGVVWYRAMMDQLDANGAEYVYGPAIDLDGDGGSPDYLLYDNRGATLDALGRIWDGDYESQAERHFDDYTFLSNTFSFRPTAHVGLGFAFKINRRINIALESRVTYTNDDLLDGQRWQEWGALTRDYDTYVYTGAHLNVNLGRKNSVEPLWWMNPLDYAYEELNEAPCCDTLPPFPDLEDDDNDGVPNAWDEEPDSREDCPVDTRGRMLDSDRDGVLDCDDQEPHTRYNAIDRVDEFGVAPPMNCDEFPDLCECVKECAPPPPPRRPYDPCASPVLPNILFDLNKYSVKPQFESQLAEVARIMRDCPNMTLCVIGNTDVRANNPYNDVLSYKRAQEVINKLVNDYGIARNRLVLQYQGESAPAIPGLSDSPVQKGIDAQHALNRRVEFRVCPPGTDMPMPAGPRNAGSRKPKP